MSMDVEPAFLPVGTPSQLAQAQRIAEQMKVQDEAAVRSAVRAAKHATIGNRTQKALFLQLDVVPRLLELLNDDRLPTDVRTEVAVTLGSLASGGESSAQQLVQANAVPLLLNSIQSGEPSLIEASLRSLKFILANANIGAEQVPVEAVTLLLRIMQQDLTPNVIELAATILAQTCELSPHRQEQLNWMKGLDPLLKLIDTNVPRMQEAAIEVLAALTLHSDTSLAHLLFQPQAGNGTTPISLMFTLAKDHRPRIRLLACTCLVNLSQRGLMNDEKTAILSTVLPTLVGLFDVGGAIQERAPYVLARLVNNSEEFQKAACDSDAITKLSSIISTSDDTTPTRAKENALLAVAAIGSSKEECRVRIVESGLVPLIVPLLRHTEAPIREAACQCLRSLSRSVKTLRSALAEVDIASTLISLLDDVNMNVRVAACAVVCNLALHFSPHQKIIVTEGLHKLAALTWSPLAPLRFNALWALKNMAFGQAGKAEVLHHVTLSGLTRHLQDPDLQVQEQSLELLQNVTADVPPQRIRAIFEGIGADVLLGILADKLASGVANIEHQALFVLVNLATGEADQQFAIMRNQRIVELLKKFLVHPTAQNRLAAVWTIINLTWNEEHRATKRSDVLLAQGFREMLMAMESDRDSEVAARVATALDHFRPQESDAMTP